MLWHKAIGAGGVGGGITYSLVDSVSASNINNTTYTMSNASIGDPAPDRVLVFAIGAGLSADPSNEMRVTVDGTLATQAVLRNDDKTIASINYISWTSGSTANLVFSLYESGVQRGFGSGGTGFAIYATYGLDTSSLVSANSIASGTTISTNLNVTDGDVVFVASAGDDTASSGGFVAGFTLDVTSYGGPSYEGVAFIGSHAVISDETPRTFTTTYPTNSELRAMVLARFSPS